MTYDYYELSKPCHGARLIAASRVKEGQEVCFHSRGFNFVVEEVDTDPLGNVRLRHGDGAASSSYPPGQLLWVR